MSWKLVLQLTNGNGKVREYVVVPNDPGFTPDCVSIKSYWSQYAWPGVEDNVLEESIGYKRECGKDEEGSFTSYPLPESDTPQTSDTKEPCPSAPDPNEIQVKE